MPLLIFAVFFAALFSFEGVYYLDRLASDERDLIRYQAVEHPRRRTSDRYLDILG